MSKKDTTIVIVILTVLLIAAVATALVILKHNQKTVLDSVAGRAFSASSSATYTNLAGEPIKLESYIGTPLVVFSWASWCPSCGDQLRMLETYANEHPEVAVLAINRAEPASTVTRFIDHHQLTETGKVVHVLDVRDHFYQSVEGYAAPETVVFAPNGSVASHFRGDISIETLRSTVVR